MIDASNRNSVADDGDLGACCDHAHAACLQGYRLTLRNNRCVTYSTPKLARDLDKQRKAPSWSNIGLTTQWSSWKTARPESLGAIEGCLTKPTSSVHGNQYSILYESMENQCDERKVLAHTREHSVPGGVTLDWGCPCECSIVDHGILYVSRRDYKVLLLALIQIRRSNDTPSGPIWSDWWAKYPTASPIVMENVVESRRRMTSWKVDQWDTVW